MTMIEKGPEISRRGVLAGLSGMSFCLALGVDGMRLVSEAEANTMAIAPNVAANRVMRIITLLEIVLSGIWGRKVGRGEKSVGENL